MKVAEINSCYIIAHVHEWLWITQTQKFYTVKRETCQWQPWCLQPAVINIQGKYTFDMSLKPVRSADGLTKDVMLL